ncbi:G protein-coupled receptor rhodopsin-like [Trinorchestia longiramus]|nr:G protein-coupled receptor rhodopsin-like [Trinorchestia longiramus]
MTLMAHNMTAKGRLSLELFFPRPAANIKIVERSERLQEFEALKLQIEWRPLGVSARRRGEPRRISQPFTANALSFCNSELLNADINLQFRELQDKQADGKLTSLVSSDLGYVIYSSLGSFYVPSAIMIFVYIRIYYAAKARANKGLMKEKKRERDNKKDDTCSLSQGRSSKPMPSISRTADVHLPTSSPAEIHRNTVNEQTVLISKKVQICDVKVHERTEQSSDQESESAPLRTLSAKVDADHRNHNVKDENGLYLENVRESPVEGTVGCTSLSASPVKEGCPPPSPCGTIRRDPSAPSVDGDQMSDMDPSSSDSGAMARCSVMKPLKMRFCHPLIGKKINKPKREMIDMGRVSTPKAMRDPEKEKRRIARKKEKRATLILGLIMGSFIACWLPFFVMYILGPFMSFPNIAFDFAFWLGYMNSAFNPVIYTIFNKDFRRAFRKILFK